MKTVSLLELIAYLVIGIGFAKVWGKATNVDDITPRCFAAALWPIWAVVCAFWSW